jgi:hypothetical protein
MSGHWKALRRDDFGWLQSVSDAVLRYEISSPGRLPYLGSSNTLLVASDYSGGNASPYRVYAFVTTAVDALGPWRVSMAELRSRLLPQQRRLSFKRLRDSNRKRALLPFLHAANKLPAFLLVIAISREIGSLLDAAGGGESNLFTPIAHWKKSTQEELFRVLCFVSLLIGGLSRPAQNALWISDEDAILANEARMKEISQLFLGLASNIVQHPMGHLRWTTTRYDAGDNNLEDLAAIPDLVAGAMLDFLQRDGALSTRMIQLDERSSPIMWWLTKATQIGSRILLLDRDEKGQSFTRTLDFNAELR